MFIARCFYKHGVHLELSVFGQPQRPVQRQRRDTFIARHIPNKSSAPAGRHDAVRAEDGAGIAEGFHAAPTELIRWLAGVSMNMALLWSFRHSPSRSLPSSARGATCL
jgi:hypothetical protein